MVGLNPLVLLVALCGLDSLPVPDAAELTADQIFSRAAAAQHAGDLAKNITSLEVKLLMSVNDRQKGRVSFDVERKFKLPDRLWTKSSETSLTGVSIQDGYDGKVAWHHDEKDEKTVLYTGPDYKGDRRRIQRDMRTMRRLIKFFFLENLRPQLSEMRRLADGADSSGDLRSFVIEANGNLEEGDESKAEIRVWIAQDDYRLLGVRLVTEENPDAPQQFCFWHHRNSPQGLWVPGSVQIYTNGEATPGQEIAIGVVENEDGERLNDIVFNREIEDDVFRPPAQ